jgi:hypothetical protein
LLAAAGLIGIGFTAGAFFGWPLLHHSSCVSDRQFITEFRIRNVNFMARVPGLRRDSLNQSDVNLEVDGERLGKLSVVFDPPSASFFAKERTKQS